MRAVRTIGIRGAGLSGLSVAQELLLADPTLSVSIFDIRPRLPHPQRTFCFFERSPNYRRVLPATKWKSVVFRGRSFERRVDVSSSPYTMIRGDDFFSATLSDLEARGVTFHFGCREVSVEGHSLRVNGELCTFDRVVDAAFDPRGATSLMWQSFAGIWVTTENPTFDPTAAILMDLQESSVEAPVSFLYVLPTSRHTALIEHTTFSPTRMPADYHLSRCFEWIQKRVGDSFHVGERERGAIPMGLETSTTTDDVVVGSNAGAVRPATGYAFLNAREHARQVCRSLLEGTRRPERVHPRWLDTADRVFLHALLRSPERGGALMEKLLARSREDALISFLSGNVSLPDALSVWLSVPKLTMIRSLLRV